MGFTKYQKVERVEVETQDEHDRISRELNRLGKTSARELTDEERKVLDNQK